MFYKQGKIKCTLIQNVGQTQKRPNSEEAKLRSVRNRTRPRGPEQNQQRELISAQKTSHEHSNKDMRHLQ